MNEENKFLMNITEQDMKDFVSGTHMEVRQMSESDLVGTWEAPYSSINHQTTFEYKKDHTFTVNYITYWSDAAFRGQMIQRYSIAGTWSIEGDSLVKVFDMNSYKMDVDENGIIYQPNQAATVEKVKKEMSQMPEHLKSLQPNPRISQAMNIDESGTRLQLTEPGRSTGHVRKLRAPSSQP